MALPFHLRPTKAVAAYSVGFSHHRVQLDIIPFRYSPVIWINYSRFGQGGPDSQPNWLHWAKEQSSWLRSQTLSEASAFCLFHSLLPYEPKGLSQFPGFHQESQKSFSTIPGANCSDHLGSLSRNSVNDEEKRDAVGFPPSTQLCLAYVQWGEPALMASSRFWKQPADACMWCLHFVWRKEPIAQTALLRGDISLALSFPGKLVMLSSACSLVNFRWREHFSDEDSHVVSLKGSFLKMRPAYVSILLTSEKAHLGIFKEVSWIILFPRYILLVLRMACSPL